ncbi:MAG: ABC transporter substrate-binding protein [Phycisphaerae bacterium]|nr:ABC transporter substrate-binding protein [Phycisphaerae bacterium]
MRIRLVSVVLGLVFAGVVCAEDVNDLKAAPDVLLKSRMDKVMTVLKQKDMDPNVMAASIEKIVMPLFDFEVMAKLAIRDHLKDMSDEQQTRYQTLFVTYLKDSYRSKLMLYSDESVKYKDPVVTNARLVQIPTEFVSKDKIIEVIYYFRKTNNLWKIYNVKIQGIGLIESYKSQFSEVIQKDGIDALLEQLKSPQPKESAQVSPSK